MLETSSLFESVPEPVTTATLPSRDQLAGTADILCVVVWGCWCKGGDSGNLENCCEDAVVDENWKLMMIYSDGEKHDIYTSSRVGTPAALRVYFVVTSGTRRPLRSAYSSSMVSVSEKTSRPSVESPGLKQRIPALLVNP